MSNKLLPRVWEALTHALGRVLRAALIGLVLGFALVEVLAAIFNRTSGDPSGFTLTWPPIFSVAPLTLFVHVMAILVALLLAYLFGFTVAVTETIHGLVYAAEHVDDAAAAIASGGVNFADAVVDAVDGPNRHGFLGVRGQNEQPERQPTQ